jgi:hypothetical protein
MRVLLMAAIPELKAVAWAASVRAATRFFYAIYCLFNFFFVLLHAKISHKITE